MFAGVPWRSIASANVSMTPKLLIRRATRIARHSRVNPSVMCLGRDEVITPDVSRALRPDPHARTVVEPKPAPRTLLARNSEALSAPDALNPVLAYPPATGPQQSRNPAIAVVPMLRRQGDDSLYCSFNSPRKPIEPLAESGGALIRCRRRLSQKKVVVAISC
jgi:hypothetical protein